VEEAELEMLEEKAYASPEDALKKEMSRSVSGVLDGTTPSNEEFLEKKSARTLAEKRSFLVRMVSDPKCYNPKIVRHLNM
uniref:Uncharacterized protein n=1 Tax=Parascaris univalens TaxID=6257 RepID=A0A914ZLG5_PARUN